MQNCGYFLYFTQMNTQFIGLFYAAMSPFTRQRALWLQQVEDLMKRSLLGAVGAPRLLLPAHPTWDGGKAVPRDHWLNLRGRWGGGGGRQDGRTTKEKNPAMKKMKRACGRGGRRIGGEEWKWWWRKGGRTGINILNRVSPHTIHVPRAVGATSTAQLSVLHDVLLCMCTSLQQAQVCRAKQRVRPPFTQRT